MRAIKGGLSEGQSQIIETVMNHVRSELVEILPELQAGIATSAAGGSFSCTLQIKPAKKGRFKATVGARVRSPRESLELDMHVSDDGQLSLGLPPGWADGDKGEAGAGGE